MSSSLFADIDESKEAWKISNVHRSKVGSVAIRVLVLFPDTQRCKSLCGCKPKRVGTRLTVVVVVVVVVVFEV